MVGPQGLDLQETYLTVIVVCVGSRKGRITSTGLMTSSVP